jgi:hypothetical protein
LSGENSEPPKKPRGLKRRSSLGLYGPTKAES